MTNKFNFRAKQRWKSENNCIKQIIHTKGLKLKTELSNKTQALFMKLIIKLSITIGVYICAIVLQQYCFSKHKRNQYSDGPCLVFTTHLNQILWFNAMQNCCVWQPNNGKSYKKNNHSINDCINPGALIKRLSRKFGYW